MHPAKSVIFFTTASGAGYGLLFLLLAGTMLNILALAFWPLFIGFGIAFLLITAGLLSSTLHLGHPERAWRAISQWRSSWLSREGVMALFTFAPTGLYALHRLFFSDLYGGLMLLIGVLGLVSIAVTVYCTAMIYASLRPIHAWFNRYVPAGYLLLSLTTGVILLNGLLALFGYAISSVVWLAIILLVIAALWKRAYWRFLDSTKSISTPESATGLGEFGTVNLLESPHSEANYLMKEMGFRIARKHSAKLRRIVIGAGFLLPAVLMVLMFSFAGPAAAAISVVAVISAGIGVVVERWLFFAEARHAVGLYYGASRA
ncbi:dimethyl sulfoxide reductase anchor subunit family protein [Sneathiella sp.]|uniref:dimethyl sulfoxide reductase anchor subunit family protein n=1 Tax=Sneathiella sp. TaxID=1964365 RepID=UPI00356265E4